MNVPAPTILILALSFGEAGAVNLLVNGDFAAGLSGWQSLGPVFDTGETAVLSDQSGPRTVVFQSAFVSGDVISLQLEFDLLTALSPVAGVGQTPDSLFGTIYFGATAFGNLYDSGTFDTATGLLDEDFRGPVNLAAGLTSGPSPKGASWTRYRMPLPLEAFVTVAFEFLDGNGQADSTTAVDNVRLEAEFIPEPAGSVLAAMAAAASLAARRRKIFLLP